MAIIPVFLLPDSFSIGSTDKDSSNTMSHEDISPSDSVWAMVAGIAG